ncbi:MAG: ABC-2 family transporter protein [Planctomycetota bacterium]
MSALAARYPRLLGRTVGYEFRKRIQFRTGFFVREVLYGVVEPLVMLFVYAALYRSADAGDGGAGASLGGWTFDEIVQYVAGLMVVRKLVFHNRGLELANEIFEGRVTKYLVMPFRFFVLLQGRFVQYTLLQIFSAAAVWGIGYAAFTERWIVPVSGTATIQALTLVLMGSYCCFLLYFVINALAFWLDVVWSLLVMAWFVISFTGGALVPVSQMPEPFFRVFSAFFPYWTITAPIELLMGRLDASDFQRGFLVLALQLLLLELLRRVVWRRGLARYVGAGM